MFDSEKFILEHFPKAQLEHCDAYEKYPDLTERQVMFYHDHKLDWDYYVNQRNQTIVQAIKDSKIPEKRTYVHLQHNGFRIQHRLPNPLGRRHRVPTYAKIYSFDIDKLYMETIKKKREEFSWEDKMRELAGCKPIAQLEEEITSLKHTIELLTETVKYLERQHAIPLDDTSEDEQKSAFE